MAALDAALFADTCSACLHLDRKPIDNISGHLVSYCHRRKTWEGWETARRDPGPYHCPDWKAARGAS